MECHIQQVNPQGDKEEPEQQSVQTLYSVGTEETGYIECFNSEAHSMIL